MKNIRLYSWLAGINLFISTFTFGGGYVVVPMVRKYFIQKKNYLHEDALLEMAAISQSTPGAIAINLVSLVGYHIAGIPGLIISCISAVIPPFAILSAICTCYSMIISNTLVLAVLKGMQAGAVALIVDFIVDMSTMILKERSILMVILAILSFFISFFTSINVIFVLLGSCLICFACIWIKRRCK